MFKSGASTSSATPAYRLVYSGGRAVRQALIVRTSVMVRIVRPALTGLDLRTLIAAASMVVLMCVA